MLRHLYLWYLANSCHTMFRMNLQSERLSLVMQLYNTGTYECQSASAGNILFSIPEPEIKRWTALFFSHKCELQIYWDCSYAVSPLCGLQERHLTLVTSRWTVQVVWKYIWNTACYECSDLTSPHIIIHTWGNAFYSIILLKHYIFWIQNERWTDSFSSCQKWKGMCFS